jgi:hypothetical protein
MDDDERREIARRGGQASARGQERDEYGRFEGRQDNRYSGSAGYRQDDYDEDRFDQAGGREFGPARYQDRWDEPSDWQRGPSGRYEDDRYSAGFGNRDDDYGRYRSDDRGNYQDRFYDQRSQQGWSRDYEDNRYSGEYGNRRNDDYEGRGNRVGGRGFESMRRDEYGRFEGRDDNRFSRNTSRRGNDEGDDRSNRGFAAMDEDERREIASRGGRASARIQGRDEQGRFEGREQRYSTRRRSA